MKQQILFFWTSLLLLTACVAKQPIDYVDPFIGTGFHGHTYPGATVPYGAVQLSPDTRRGNWDACSGYHYSDSTMFGFSHTHLSGTGCIDLGDILFHPTTHEVKATGGGFDYSPLEFSHNDEEASPGYYSVILRNEGIKAELTATTYTGVHRYSYDKGKPKNLVIDLSHLLTEELIDSIYIKQVSDNEIAGMRRTQGWVPDQYIFFIARFSEGFESATYTDHGAILNFGVSDGKPLVANVGVSIVSEENARENLSHETEGFDFDKIRLQAREQWGNALSDIRVEGGTDADLKNFYTALYHTKIIPNIVSDAKNKEKRFSTFSIWDTFRAWNPLVTLTNHTLVNDMINSYLDMYDATGELPIWPLSAGETGTMIGYHSVSVIADAFMKGIRGYDIEKAYQAMKTSSNINKKGSDYYIKYGFIPSNIKKESVSCLLEYAYDDWCIAQVAKELGKEDDYHEYIRRSQNYIHVFDGYTKFFRGKRMDGNWETPFNPFTPGRAYTEATAWQYRFFVPHDVNGMIQLFGGKDSFAEQLDSLFIVQSEIDGNMQDITGLIGQYAHGNEPSHHMAYLYNYIGKPWEGQAMTRRILKEMYAPTPEGIIGNEDCGQMSAWHIFSGLGFYPVCPGSNEFVLTTPLFGRATVRLANGKVLEIKANDPQKNVYIDKVTLNGEEITNNYITYEQLMAGGTLDYRLSDKPNKDRGVAESSYPYSETKGLVVSIPYTTQDLDLFIDKTEVSLASATPETKIYYTLDNTESDETSSLYTAPFTINSTQTIKAKAYKEGYTPSHTFSIQATKAVFENPVVAIGKENGTNFRYYEGYFQSVSEIENSPVRETGVLPSPTIKESKTEDHFAFIFSGIIFVPEDGVYEFMTRSDDGSVLYINNKKIVDNDGSHAAIVASGRIALKKGYHSYRLMYFEDYEGEHLSWGWKKPSAQKFESIPTSHLFIK